MAVAGFACLVAGVSIRFGHDFGLIIAGVILLGLAVIGAARR